MPKGVPPIELLDGAEVLEPEPEGVPNPENDDEAEDDDEDEGGLEPVGNPNPEAAAETNAELGGVNPPGTFIPAGGWPPALALEGRPTLSAIELESCEPLGEPAGGNPGYGWFARSALAEEEPGLSPAAPPSAGAGSTPIRLPPAAAGPESVELEPPVEGMACLAPAA